LLTACAALSILRVIVDLRIIVDDPARSGVICHGRFTLGPDSGIMQRQSSRTAGGTHLISHSVFHFTAWNRKQVHRLRIILRLAGAVDRFKKSTHDDCIGERFHGLDQ
jgi:hypothetical protein